MKGIALLVMIFVSGGCDRASNLHSYPRVGQWHLCYVYRESSHTIGVFFVLGRVEDRDVLVLCGG